MTTIRRLHLPMREAQDVGPFLGAERHWAEGRSAKLVAETWFAANELPEMVRITLDDADRFKQAELVDAFLERRVELGDGLTPSQVDVLAILGLKDELAVMAVEGKVDESFGPLVSVWLVNASDQKHERLERLANTLGLEISACEPLRYQLLHRTASAIYEARRYRAKLAVMMVHSFDPGDAGVDDFKRFATEMKFLGADATRLAGPVDCDGVDLYLGWSADRPSSEGFYIKDRRKTDVGLYDD